MASPLDMGIMTRPPPDSRKLSNKLRELLYKPTLQLRQGKIKAVDGSRVTVEIGADGVDIPDIRYFAHYTPTQDDTVWLIQNGPDYIVLGKLA